jgi:hypothetical protein
MVHGKQDETDPAFMSYVSGRGRQIISDIKKLNGVMGEKVAMCDGMGRELFTDWVVRKGLWKHLS